MRYIIRNCPCFNEGHPNLDLFGECLDLTQSENDCCAEVTNCLIKQVIERCREVQCPCPDVGACCYEYPINIEKDFASKILELFEIEEVNNNK